MAENILKSKEYWQKFADRVEKIEYYFVNAALQSHESQDILKMEYMQEMHNRSAEIEEKIISGEELDESKIFIENTEKEIAVKLVERGFNISDIAQVIEENSPLQLSKEQSVSMIKEHLQLDIEEKKKDINITNNSQDINITENDADKIKNNTEWEKYREQLLAFSQYKIDQYLENTNLDQRKVVNEKELTGIMRASKIIKTIGKDLVSYIKNKIAQRRRMNKILNYSNFMSNYDKFKDHIKNIFKGTESIVVLLEPKEIFNEVSKNINYEYLKEANLARNNDLGKLTLKEELSRFGDTDLTVAKRLLFKGFSSKDVSRALSMNSPFLLSNEEAQNITKQAQKFLLTQRILKMPDVDFEHKTVADQFIVLAKKQLNNRSEWELSDDAAVIKGLLQKKYKPEKVMAALKLSPSQLSQEKANEMVKAACVELNIEKIEPNDNEILEKNINNVLENKQNNIAQKEELTEKIINNQEQPKNKLTNAEYVQMVRYAIKHPAQEREERFINAKEFTSENKQDTLNNKYLSRLNEKIKGIGGDWKKWDKNIGKEVTKSLIRDGKYPIQDIIRTTMLHSPEMPDMEEARQEVSGIVAEIKKEKLMDINNEKQNIGINENARDKDVEIQPIDKMRQEVSANVNEKILNKEQLKNETIENPFIESRKRVEEIRNFDGKDNTPDNFYKKTAGLIMDEQSGGFWDKEVDKRTIGLMMLENYTQQQIVNTVTKNSPEFPKRQQILDNIKEINKNPKFQQILQKQNTKSIAI